MRRWTHEVHLYYGANARPPKKHGVIAIAVNTIGNATDMEIRAGKNRPDIGRITVRDLVTGKITTVQDEHCSNT
jgi:hypothetical protein